MWAVPSARITVPILNRLANGLPAGSRFRSNISDRAASRYRDFWALNEISFVLKKGEALGVIGRNGSGKSTLLQIIAGTLQPTTGSVRLHGRVSALLELGSGFNPEFTGRENVYLNGSVLGLSRREIDDRYDQIADFADIGEFIDQPVKTYSSGMMIRLAFAVAVSVDPEVLIVDEALSVGDVFFQQKCFKRVHEMLDKGVSLLFVSHDTAAVQNLCDRAILLAKGDMIYEGLPEEAASRYYTIGSSPANKPVLSLGSFENSQPKVTVSGLRDDILANNILTGARSRHGAHDAELLGASFRTAQSLHSFNAELGSKVTIDVVVRAKALMADLSVGVHLFDRMNNLVFAAGSRQMRTPLRPFAKDEERVVRLELTLNVQPGEYTFSLGCAESSGDGPNVGYLQDRYEGLGPISVFFHADVMLPFYGVAQLPLMISECR